MNEQNRKENEETTSVVSKEKFHSLFLEFEPQLKSYLYRITANRSDAEDISQDTFVRAYEKLSTYRGESSLKTWVFQIATHIAFNKQKHNKRWTVNVSEEAKRLVMENPSLSQKILFTRSNSPAGAYEVKEHIDTCFTCMAKNLPIEKQITLILKDIYDFSTKEISLILDRSYASVKHMVSHSREILNEIYEYRCALVNKNGVCHQCKELNQWLNPLDDHDKKMEGVKRDLSSSDPGSLYDLRAQLIKAIDPLQTSGFELQEVLLRCNRIAMGEEELPKT
ncbi:RNA polymerase, sigma-24 subunit, ECF subfamily [Leptospira ryugenii]|uniref:RNA polymerase, sigma-24 subunit, ECF subfamily n=1 Tax=Leptospira ryugenii TaxID=1917863 RepID=A0A2P2E0E8_9LEPT|nr:RNA polymerase sigma factor [Leptospira ryugenii]GBF50357.1 RNA polymerase, sigma-24 subunit, ECF subfamily [Leptospira ryugenii]